MSLREAKGNMYTYVTHLFDPLRGSCSHLCEYCYVQRMGPVVKAKYTGLPVLDYREMKTNLESKSQNPGDCLIGVCLMTDLFAADVPNEIIHAVMAQCNRYPGVDYLFQSKNPERFHQDWEWPGTASVGTTIESDIRHYCMGETPSPWDRAHHLGALAKNPRLQRFVTIEPILKFTLTGLVALIEEARPHWVNIGADSKGCGLPEPKAYEVLDLIQVVQNLGIELVIKGNLERLLDTDDAGQDARMDPRPGGRKG